MLKPLCEKLFENQIFTLSKVPSHRLLINYKGEKVPLYGQDQADVGLTSWSNSASPIMGRTDIMWLLMWCSKEYTPSPLLAKSGRKQSDIARRSDSLKDNRPRLGRKCQCWLQKQRKSEIALTSRRWNRKMTN